MLINTEGYDVSFTFPAALDDTRWVMHVTTDHGETHILDGSRYHKLEWAHEQALRFGVVKVPRPHVQTGMRPVAMP